MLETAVAGEPFSAIDRYDIFANLGRAYAGSGHPERAAQLFEECIAAVEELGGDPTVEARYATLLSYALTDMGEIARAEAHKVTAKAQAEADQSGPLAQATATKDVIKEQTELAELDAVRREKELLGTTVKPAEAERRAAIVKAEGLRQATILAAEAHAQQVQLTGEAEGAANVARGRAAAQVTEISGAAEGAAILSRGQAEARSKELLAEAYRKFDEAAILLQTLPLVPPIVREAAAPLGNIDNLTVIDPSGASKLTETVVRTAAEGTAIAKSLLGVDLAELMGRLAARRDGEEKR